MYKKEFDSSYVGFMKDGAKWLVENTDIKLVGKILTLILFSWCYLVTKYILLIVSGNIFETLVILSYQKVIFYY